jgi:phage terminase small subunit
MRGRKPKPAVMKDLHGSEKPRNPLEPIPEGKLTDDPADGCPDFFNDEQRAIWTYAVEHSPPGVLRRIDAPALGAWVIALWLHRRASQQMSRSSLLIRNGTQPIPSPLMSIINKQALIMLKAAAELGFTPVSRPRILANRANDGDDLSRAAHAGTPADDLDSYLASAPSTASTRH